MLKAPDFNKTPLSEDQSERIAQAFQRGIADGYPARSLVRAGVVSYHPLRGGIYYRREPVKYIIVHSTEPVIPVSAVRIIESWSSMGRRHPGAQYVVDRDGSIYQCVDPDLATVHVNIFKTLPGINNDNSIGIEMCHSGRQDYPKKQRDAVIKLVSYLQDRYQVQDDNVITHRYAQQGDHTDPVNFDWVGFLSDKGQFRRKAVAYRVNRIKEVATTWKPGSATQAPQSVLSTQAAIQAPPAAPTAGATIQAPPAAPAAGATIQAPPAAPTAGATIQAPPAAPAAGAGVPPTTLLQPHPVQGPSSSQRGVGPLQLRGPIEVEPEVVTQLNDAPPPPQASSKPAPAMPPSAQAPSAKPPSAQAPSAKPPSAQPPSAKPPPAQARTAR